jgi:hypothetical protein
MVVIAVDSARNGYQHPMRGGAVEPQTADAMQYGAVRG